MTSSGVKYPKSPFCPPVARSPGSPTPSDGLRDYQNDGLERPISPPLSPQSKPTSPRFGKAPAKPVMARMPYCCFNGLTSDCLDPMSGPRVPSSGHQSRFPPLQVQLRLDCRLPF
ncbi:hypothetical protein BJV77DRAFT_1148114 [Russula vinacea]|nr:hypothetical protein BJV77DRAFT_1148114 [Russula vinacea]